MTRAQELAKQLPTYQHPGLGRALVDEACQELLRMDAIEDAAHKVVAAFEALGKAQHAGALLMERGNCETAMVALKAALFNTGAQRAAVGGPTGAQS